MKMRNSSAHSVTVPSDIIATWSTNGPRPETVTIPSGAVVEVKDEFAVRRRARHGSASNAQPLPSVVHDLTGGALVPHGHEAEQLHATSWHDSLPSVIVELAKQATMSELGVSSRPDPLAEQRRLDEEFGRRMRAAMGEQRASAPAAVPVIANADEA